MELIAIDHEKFTSRLTVLHRKTAVIGEIQSTFRNDLLARSLKRLGLHKTTLNILYRSIGSSNLLNKTCSRSGSSFSHKTRLQRNPGSNSRERSDNIAAVPKGINPSYSR